MEQGFNANWQALLGMPLQSVRSAWLLLCLSFMVDCLLGVAPAQEVAVGRTLKQMQHTGWTPRNGAPVGIQIMAQSADGYLWLGTPSGLYRFDGIQFER